MELNKRIAELEEEITSLKDTLRNIARDTNEHTTHNIAQNELDRWEGIEECKNKHYKSVDNQAICCYRVCSCTTCQYRKQQS